MALDKFVDQTVKRKGVQGISGEDPRVKRINREILTMEEIFEHRRHSKAPRFVEKEKVFTKMSTGIA